MSFVPPRKILIKSDDNQISYVKTIPKSKSFPEMFLYKFIKSKTKLNTTVSFSEVELIKGLNNYFEIL